MVLHTFLAKWWVQVWTEKISSKLFIQKSCNINRNIIYLYLKFEADTCDNLRVSWSTDLKNSVSRQTRFKFYVLELADLNASTRQRIGQIENFVFTILLSNWCFWNPIVHCRSKSFVRFFKILNWSHTSSIFNQCLLYNLQNDLSLALSLSNFLTTKFPFVRFAGIYGKVPAINIDNYTHYF